MSINASSAFSVAIESVRMRTDLTEKQKEEITSLLHNAAQRDWFVHWDKEKIIRALLDYKERTGCAPTVTNLTETGMPKSLTIQTHFGMKASLLLRQLFPEQRRTRDDILSSKNPFGFVTQEQWLTCFKEQYKKQSGADRAKVRSREYDAHRDNGTPAWYTIAVHCGVKTWNGLKELADITDEPSASVPATKSYVKIKSVKSPYIDMLKEQNDRREILLAKIEKEEATKR